MSNCPGTTFTVTNQGDADRLASSPCGSINIQQAEGTLNFTNVTGSWDKISVSNSLGLQILEVLRPFSLNLLQISDATSLDELLLPRLIGGNISYTENGAYSNATSFGNLELLGLPSVANDYYVPASVVTALSIQTDSCLNTARLEAIGDFRIVGVVDCNYQFQNLKSVGNLSLVNAANFRTALLADVDSFGPLLVNESMILDNEANEAPVTEVHITATAPYPDLAFDRVSQIGKDLNITSYASVNVSFGGLTDIGSSLVISSNTNCTFNFDHVSTATNLILLDNPDSILPLFPELETVENNENKIHNLVCNGTNNGTSIPSMNSGSNGSLSPGAKAGIGVGSGIFGLGIIVALTWLILHFRRRLKSVETAVLQGTTVYDDKPEKGIDPPEVNEIQKTDGAGIIREMPDDHLVELHANVPELPEYHLVELHSGTT
ncbi:hypothetical protein GGR58DRAFT_515503 [Xylaria digitata]|nr:hypothetical protein GGR58DRAFT_515503 [Xylaria digitata]